MTLNRDTASQNHINFYYFFIYIYTEYCSFIIPNTPARNNTQNSLKYNNIGVERYMNLTPYFNAESTM